jgi:hypothetical protein
MATSPLFGWEEPDDTDLVKDGAAAIRTLGNAIDTSMGDLLGGTTGQVLSKASNTNMDFTWVTSDDANAIQNTIVDAKGDLIAATATDTPARLAVGANDLVLTADSTQSTGLKYSGNWTTFTPSFFNLTIGNGTLTARYAKTAKTVNYFIRLVFGSTTSVTGSVSFTLPIAPNNTEGPIGDVFIDDPGTAGYLGQCVAFGGNPFISVGRSDATFLKYEIINATVPMTWGTGDALNIRGSYEVA